MKKLIVALVLFTISIAAFIFYLTHRIPSDIETKGAEQVTVMIALATTIVSLATAMVTLVTTIWTKRK